MVYTLIDHKMTSKNAQNSSGIHYHVLDILRHHFMIYERIDHRKLLLIFFYNNTEKVYAELVLFSVKKARMLHLMSFLTCECT